MKVYSNIPDPAGLYLVIDDGNSWANIWFCSPNSQLAPFLFDAFHKTRPCRLWLTRNKFIEWAQIKREDLK